MRDIICRCVLLGLVWLLAAPALPAGEAADRREGWRQLGRLRAELASRAAREGRSPAKAGLLYLQAAQAFERAGETEEARSAETAAGFDARHLRATFAHARGVVAMTFLSSGRQVLTVGAGGDVRVWDSATGREVRSFQAKEADAPRIQFDAAFSRNRSWMLLWGEKTVQLWDVAGGRLFHQWERKESLRVGAFLHNDRRVLLFGEPETKPRLWDLEKQRPVGEIDKGGLPEWRLMASPDGRRFFTADKEALYLWDAADAKLLHRFSTGEDKRDPVFPVVFSPDGKQFLALGYRDGSGLLYDAVSGKLLHKVSVGSPNLAQGDRDRADSQGAEFSTDGKRLLTWDSEGTARVWDAARGKLLRTFQREEPRGRRLRGPGARLSRDGTQLLMFGDPAHVWYAMGDDPGTRLGLAADGMFTRDRQRMVLWGEGCNTEVWGWGRSVGAADSERLQRRLSLEGLGHAAEAVLSEDETLLLVRDSSDARAAVRLWDLRYLHDWHFHRDAPVPSAVVFKHDHAVLTGALDRAEGRVLTCDAGGQAHLWNAKDGRRLRSFRHSPGARGAAFHPDETRVVTWGEGGVKVWDLKTGKEVKALANEAEVRGVAFDPDGSHLLTWDVDYTARWWDLAHGTTLHRFEHRRDLFGAKLDRQGTRALTWGFDGEAKVWDLASGRLVRALAHDRPVSGAAFALNADRVWSWTAEGFFEWDLKTGKRLRLLKPRFCAWQGTGHSWITGVATAELNRDGRRFVLSDLGGRVRYWDVASGQELPPPGLNPYTDTESYRGEPPWVFNAEQTRLATRGPEATTVLLNDLGSGMQLQVFRHEGRVNGMAFGGDDSRLLTWSNDNTARLWETESPRPWAADDQLLELEVRSGFRVDVLGRLQALPFDQWQARRERLDGTVRKKYRHRGIGVSGSHGR